MKVLFTGGSSFTGYWFIQELVAAGHSVSATLRRPVHEYEGVRRERVSRLREHCRFLDGVGFGDDAFIAAIEGESDWDVLCHHAADVTDYKSSSFDIHSALANNTRNIQNVLKGLCDRGCRRIVLTGSIFECDEGAGSDSLEAFSPYGLSKALTASVFRYWSQVMGMSLGKFVIANPFGPFEEPRFTSYLSRTWLKGETATVRTPDYVRDNVHISLLAKAYCQFVGNIGSANGIEKLIPSQYVGSQGDFAMLMARQMRTRLGKACEVECMKQVEFTEPRVRIGTDTLDINALNWDEQSAWDELADYYSTL